MPLIACTSPTLLWVMLICCSFRPPFAIVASEAIAISDYGPPIEHSEMTSSDEPDVDGMRGKHLLIIPWPVVHLDKKNSVENYVNRIFIAI